MYLFFIAIYVIGIVAIGLLSMSKIDGISDFFLGGRSVNPWMSAFSYGTAYFSAVIFIGYAGKIGWGFGLSALWVAIGNTLVGSFLAWHILGSRTREMTNRLNASTMPEFIGIRYQSKSLKIVTAAIIFIFLIPYSASVYKGLGYLFEQVFGISNMTILIIIALFTAFYLVLGGFVASTIADFIQGIIMIIGVIMMLFYVISHPTVGGFSNLVSSLRDIDGSLVKPIGPQGLLTTLSLVILTSLGSWGLPQMVHKFYTIKDERSIKCAKWVSTSFALLITFGAYFTGITSRMFFPESMPMLNGVPNPDIIIPKILFQTLPDVVLGIILILILSASMSTLASLVLASSSAIALDFIQGILYPDIDNKKLTLIMRGLCLLFVILSFFMAILPNPIMTLAALSWGAVSGSLLAPYLYGLFWPKATKVGVWAGIITALAIVIGGAIYTGMNEALTPIFGAAAIVLPLLIVPLVSLATQSINEEHLNKIYNISKVDAIKA
ncbi:MAG TPA: sodium:solute symporter [Clostridia bacterium]|nr:sodium:solute symporter [Clostridia bacterium]